MLCSPRMSERRRGWSWRTKGARRFLCSWLAICLLAQIAAPALAFDNPLNEGGATAVAGVPHVSPAPILPGRPLKPPGSVPDSKAPDSKLPDPAQPALSAD